MDFKNIYIKSKNRSKLESQMTRKDNVYTMQQHIESKLDAATEILDLVRADLNSLAREHCENMEDIRNLDGYSDDEFQLLNALATRHYIDGVNNILSIITTYKQKLIERHISLQEYNNA